MKRKPLSFFIKNIGKRIYRTTKANCCKSCDNVEKDGLIIHDRMHAECLKMYQDEYPCEYSDKKI